MIEIISAIIPVFLLTYAGVELFRRWSLKRELLDHPNERSSHSSPTPRGGGLIICLVSLLALLVYFLASGRPLPWAYFIGAALVSAISWLDDLGSVSPLTRFSFHGAAALLLVISMGGFATIYLPFYGVSHLGEFGKVLAFLWIIGLINAYNFMDGIDGLAAVQAVSAGLGWMVIGYFYGLGEIHFYGAVLVASCFAFLLHNWQPAKIFLGDVGSAFLGYTFAVLPLMAVLQSADREIKILYPIFGGLFVWFFIFDAVITFFRRLLIGEKVWEAHRKHIYQELVQSGWSHRQVTILYGAGSLLIILVVLAAVFYARYFGNILWGFVTGLTALLVVLWLKSRGRGNKPING